MSDKIPVVISERLIDVSDFGVGKLIKVQGQYRSYNQITETGKSKLILSVFVKDIETENTIDKNIINNRKKSHIKKDKVDISINTNIEKEKSLRL